MRRANLKVLLFALAGFFAAGEATSLQALSITIDFSSGNPVSSTDYSLTTLGASTVPGGYRVVNNPADPTFGNHYGSFFDHTIGNSTGAMLFFDGSSTNTNRIFYFSAALIAGQEYDFSYWQAGDNLSSIPNLQAFVTDGITSTPLGGLAIIATQTWTQFSTSFTPGSSGSYTFSIRDINTSGPFNDGALDDIQLTEVPDPVTGVPEPAALALFALGTGMLVRRRYRQRG